MEYVPSCPAATNGPYPIIPLSSDNSPPTMSSTPSGSVRMAVKTTVSPAVIFETFVFRLRNTGAPGAGVEDAGGGHGVEQARHARIGTEDRTRHLHVHAGPGPQQMQARITRGQGAGGTCARRSGRDQRGVAVLVGEARPDISDAHAAARHERRGCGHVNRYRVRGVVDRGRAGARRSSAARFCVSTAERWPSARQRIPIRWRFGFAARTRTSCVLSRD